jgi:putative endonuclease
MDFRKIRGQSGESIALAYLEERGFRLIERNWNCRLGEIDLIVERGGETRFIEVKLRRTMEYGYPEASITRTKLRHLSRAIECWMKVQANPPICYQADAIAIFAPLGMEPAITWIEGIF